MNKADFKFYAELRVRNYEVDWQGIVHNANYLLYFEVGRLEYLKRLGVKVDLNTIQSESRIVLVRNEINYKSSARFDDLIKVHTRVSAINNSSFVFEGILEDATTGVEIADNVAVHVWLDKDAGTPVRVKDEFRKDVSTYEGGSVLIKG